jgi:hypothetical protein
MSQFAAGATSRLLDGVAAKRPIFITAAALLLVASGCGAAKRIYVQGSYKPHRVVLGAGTPIKDVRWLSYGGDEAKANGMFGVNDCHPTCAAGHITWEPTSFSVTNVGPCKGKRSYRLISIPIRGIKGFELQDCQLAVLVADQRELDTIRLEQRENGRLKKGHGPGRFGGSALS